MCFLTLHIYPTCGHKLWTIEEACPDAMKDETFPYPACKIFTLEITATMFNEPPAERVVEVVVHEEGTCERLKPPCKFDMGVKEEEKEGREQQPKEEGKEGEEDEEGEK
ncbi:hypothetical protein L873DRAFT_1794186 [Choiromyces venosus 120613-1]|uniref:Uncharacterized protein n=1 Tax=Choiromyces venosus 120613-1 TaxID=1336337 RepID=A0A3N4J635_9PEZI|nr:hypothetical protein L873DRAFT_1794186 [Choiromyces venosus 120613-1]